MFCSKCGTRLDDSANFCSKCGAKVVNSAEVNYTNQQTATDIPTNASTFTSAD